VPNSASPRIGFRVVQAERPQGRTLPATALPRNAENVSQTVPKLQPVAPHVPFFAGPQPFVRIPDGSVGPVFVSQNHSPAITECPNGDLLAVWFSTIGETDLTTSNAAARLRLGAPEWEAASPFWDPQDVNDHAPKIWWDGGETIYHIVEARQHGDNLIRRSMDNGVTWTRAEVLCPRGEPANNPIRTRDGVIAVPYDNASLVISRDQGKTWHTRGRDLRGGDDVRPGKSGPCIAGIHAPIVELADGRLMAFGRLAPEDRAQKLFDLRMPASSSSDLGETWQWDKSEFPVVSNTQKPVLLRLSSSGGDYTGYGLYAAVSRDEGRTWPHRRLIALDGVTTAPMNGYLAVTQTRDHRIQLLTSKDHYIFNLAWLEALPLIPPSRTP
jgi:hypothetical protein